MASPAERAAASHQPVLYQQIIHALRPEGSGRYVDGTVGAGGHAYGILQASAPDGKLLGLDVDPHALDLARERLQEFGPRATLVRASYAGLAEQLDRLEWEEVQGVLLDLGLSSMQLDKPERGFSFRSDGPLDMRFDPDGPRTAADLINELPERELADLIYRFGEERASRAIARAAVDARPIHTTRELADLVAGVVRSRPGGIHPATRTFQALRIAVNRELTVLAEALPRAIAALAPAGRLAVIAYHSLEDRIVKVTFRQESRDCICPPEIPVCECGHEASLQRITRKPIRPEASEIRRNPRARSARLRVAEKLPGVA